MTYESPEEIAAREREREQELLNDATGPLIAKIDIQGRQIAELEAMLCGLMSSLVYLEGYGCSAAPVAAARKGVYDAVHDNFDETECGVTWQQLENWWTEHKAEDARRKAAEQVILAVQRRKALAKLTPAERELLGV
jgi:hypothetical protein